MKKTFDCIEMKRRIQERIYDEIRNLSREEEIAYFHRAGEEFWREIHAARKKKEAKTHPEKGAF